MSNFYFPEYDCVLIHIPKSGGTSIRKGVFGGNYEGPFFGEIPEKYSKCFKFAFVRNPFDRLISAWKMFTEGTDLLNKTENKKPIKMSLENFLEIVTDESIIYDERRSTFEEKIRHHTIPQTHPFNCLEQADFIGRYENIEKDFALISQAINLQEANLPVMHASKRSRSYKEYFSSYTKKIAENFFELDLKKLRYDF